MLLRKLFHPNLCKLKQYIFVKNFPHNVKISFAVVMIGLIKELEA